MLKDGTVSSASMSNAKPFFMLTSFTVNIGLLSIIIGTSWNDLKRTFHPSSALFKAYFGLIFT